MSASRFRRTVELFWFWLYPFLTLFLVYRQVARGHSDALGWFMVLSPALTMYIVVGMGAGWLRLWYFTTPYSPRGVMLTIGFLYSAVLNPFAVGLLGVLPQHPIIFVLGVALGGAALGTAVDVFLLKARLLHVKAKHYPPGSPALPHALSYGPAFFSMVGLVNGLGLLLGYHRLTADSTALLPTLALVVPVCALPFLIFLGIQRSRQLRHRRAKQQVATTKA
jgi:hypothetical protein